MEAIKGKINSKKLMDWINGKFLELEIKDYKIVSVNRTHYSQDAYEGGASRLIIEFVDLRSDINSLLSKGYFNCFYPLRELNYYLNNGYELFLKDRSRMGILSQFELDVRKK